MSQGCCQCCYGQCRRSGLTFLWVVLLVQALAAVYLLLGLILKPELTQDSPQSLVENYVLVILNLGSKNYQS